ncbi:zf-C2H2_6 domain-containing protein [Cephalotus follicularis]|uniref:Zf-C2H2_6 domain-containing protein n=1 Tax=Cephalotus follicularis TaxID=3775 RepID=A0A1Q3B2M7_CEPFO|nr:zf-C2H2_6 domain-containing protein [Cephalotus follicularis]
MDKYKCKLCLRTFNNGRALGGHMRSHMLNLPIPPKTEEGEEEEEETAAPIQLSEESVSSSEEDEEFEEKELCYELRENPKKSIRLVDPEFFFAVDAGSVVLQDRESETESSKNPTRRRSKRTRKSTALLEHHHHQYHHQQKQRQEQEQPQPKFKFNKVNRTETWAPEPEPVSSISDATTEEDVAFCLMMLSRDKWKRKELAQQAKEEQEDHDDDNDDDEDDDEERSMEDTDQSDELKFCRTGSRGKYKCDTCNKVFKSYQALGGHRASHKKIKVNTPSYQPEFEPQNAGTSGSGSMTKKKVHECPVCFRVFSSGQALGGHKRTHVIGAATATATTTTGVKSCAKFGDNWIDLNLPAPIDDDDISQIELSAVSDAEFVNHIRL